MTENGCPRSPFDPLAGEYDSWFDGKGRLLFLMETEAFRPLLPALPKPWLEMGLGSGRFARALGIETGVDPSREMLLLARNRGLCPVEARGEQMPFRDGSWGSVFCIVTLCFLESPQEALLEAHRILAPGGKLVAGLVLKESPWGQLCLTKKLEGHRYYRHARLLGYEEILRMLDGTGFVPEQTLSTLFEKPGEVRRLERPRKGYFPEAGFTVISAGKKPAGTLSAAGRKD